MSTLVLCRLIVHSLYKVNLISEAIGRIDVSYAAGRHGIRDGSNFSAVVENRVANTPSSPDVGSANVQWYTYTVRSNQWCRYCLRVTSERCTRKTPKRVGNKISTFNDSFGTTMRTTHDVILSCKRLWCNIVYTAIILLFTY